MSEAREKVLVVEDEKNMRTMLTIYLQRKGYEVYTAPDAPSAKKIVTEETFPLILCDIKMPGGNGLEVLRAAKEHIKDVEVIMLTALANIDTVLEAVKLGAYDYVLKPVDDLDRDLGGVIARALEKRRLITENKRLVGTLKETNAALRLHQAQVDRELEIASVIQQSLLPGENPLFEKLNVRIARFTAEAVSGDFYDVFERHDGSVGLFIGQAFGRDIPAALLMAMVSGRLRELFMRDLSPREILNEANASVRKCLEKGWGNFVTVFCGIFDFRTHAFRYATAQHTPPFVVHFHAKDGEVQPLTAQGQFLGKYADGGYKSLTVRFSSHDRFVFFTEGLINVENYDGDIYGVERLQEMALETGPGDTALSFGRILDDIGTFAKQPLEESDSAILFVDIKQ